MSTTRPSSLSPILSFARGARARLQRCASRALLPFERFLQIEAASSILLWGATALALGWSNSPWSETYTQFWHTLVAFRVGDVALERPLDWLVNDVLMVIFFFVVGLEIRREIHDGELSEWRRAVLPAAAALGGMLAPACLYLFLAGAPATRSGWGVSVATDIAFAVGILTLLGPRVPPALRMLLLALAVIDDLGAILVIAVFYSPGSSVSALLVAALGYVGVVVLQRIGVRTKLAYLPPSIVAWAGTYAAGVHPAIAGVALGLLTPVHAWSGPGKVLTDLGSQAPSPAQELIEMLHPWVALVIMPVFALANAGVTVSTISLDGASWAVGAAVGVALLIGKPLGVLMACYVTLRLGIATPPMGIRWRHLLVLGVVAGVGFTMALFISQLAFTDPRLLAAAKLGVLASSAAAALLALVLGHLLLTPTPMVALKRRIVQTGPRRSEGGNAR